MPAFAQQDTAQLSDSQLKQLLRQQKRDSIRAHKKVWISVLGGPSYNPEASFGIGGDFPRGHQVDYVLGQWTEEERREMPERLKYFGDAILSFASVGPERTMNLFNKK